MDRDMSKFPNLEHIPGTSSLKTTDLDNVNEDQSAQNSSKRGENEMEDRKAADRISSLYGSSSGRDIVVDLLGDKKEEDDDENETNSYLKEDILTVRYLPLNRIGDTKNEHQDETVLHKISDRVSENNHYTDTIRIRSLIL